MFYNGYRMPRTDGIGAALPGGNGNGKMPWRNPTPAKGCSGGKGKSCATSVGHLLLPMKTPGRGFTPLEARFITEYLKDPMATAKDLAIRAGYSPHSANQIGGQLLRKPHILAEIEDQMHAFVQRERLSIERLVRHLIELAEVDKRDFYNENGSLKSPTELTKVQAALIKGMSVSEIWDSPGARDKVQLGELKKITLTDHLEPVKMLTKSLQGFVDRMEVKSQSLNYHKHEHSIKGGNNDIDYTVLTEDDLIVLKGLHDKARELTRAKLAGSRSRIEGRA